ncbi:type II secretion system protein [Chitinimonas arctica]|uniref:Type II secretion system protein n=1 Tax=Chitinimonas arctica TaxID=2594795 RepID=A0A516SB95_9NEIS|nr:type II secretion system protein [Chitinimonas arctica]QDQ25421.1 type II secretion system protein [Chitinimonas arctica]
MPTGKQRQAGLAYFWLMGVLLIMGLLLGKAVEVSATQAERQREAELLYVGGLYRDAIRHYVEMPGGNGRYPGRLEDLLMDPRFLQPVRHLRQLYIDPETGQRDWAVINAPGGGVMGVHSISTRMPHKQDDFSEANAEFVKKPSLSEWVFVHQPGTPSSTVK